ncbi:MAG: ATP-binding protein [Steroidobacteraceae bacterium]
MRTPEGGTVRVGETLESRQKNTSRIALRIDQPLALTSIPLLALLIWVAVGRSLRPLTTLANSLVRRKPGSLDALSADRQPQEIRPIVEALNDLLQRVSRALDSERQFIADAAHELQTPLTAVRLQLQVVERATTEETKKTALKRLDLGMHRATHVVGQLLMMARLEPDVSQAPLAVVTLETLIVEVLGEYAVIAQERGIDLGASVLEPAQILGERNGLRALLGNLIDNAIRYSPDNGEVDVNLRRNDVWTILEIVDSGPGIPLEERVRVLHRFYRSAASGISGSGLGLAIVKRIADQHHAEIVLGENPNGRGLRVEVRFRNDVTVTR